MKWHGSVSSGQVHFAHLACVFFPIFCLEVICSINPILLEYYFFQCVASAGFPSKSVLYTAYRQPFSAPLVVRLVGAKFLALEVSEYIHPFHMLSVSPWACTPPFFLPFPTSYDSDLAIITKMWTRPRGGRPTMWKEPPKAELTCHTQLVKLLHNKKVLCSLSGCHLKFFGHSGLAFTLKNAEEINLFSKHCSLERYLSQQ